MKDLFKKLAAVIFGCILALAMLEVLLRLLPAPSAGVAEVNDTGALYAYDSFLGWRLIPNASAHQKSQDFDVTYHVNAQGLRGQAKFAAKAAKGKTRVAVVGDSFAFGIGLADDKTFEEQLAAENSKYEVLNMGVSGYDPGQYLLSLENDGPKFQPNVTVMALYLGNDIEDLPLPYLSQGPRYFKPYFTLAANGDLDIHNEPVPKGSSTAPVADRRLKNNLFAMLFGWMLKLRTVQLASNVLKNNAYPLLERAGLVKSADDYTSTLAVLDAIFRAADASTFNHFAVMVIPSIHVKDNYLERELAGRITASLDKDHIPYVNLVPDVVSSTEQLYFPHEGHWNEKGAALAARKLGALLDSLATSTAR